MTPTSVSVFALLYAIAWFAVWLYVLEIRWRLVQRWDWRTVYRKTAPQGSYLAYAAWSNYYTAQRYVRMFEDAIGVQHIRDELSGQLTIPRGRRHLLRRWLLCNVLSARTWR